MRKIFKLRGLIVIVITIGLSMSLAVQVLAHIGHTLQGPSNVQKIENACKIGFSWEWNDTNVLTHYTFPKFKLSFDDGAPVSLQSGDPYENTRIPNASYGTSSFFISGG